MRHGIKDSHVFLDIRAANETVSAPIREAMLKHWREILIAAGQRFAQPALYTLLTTVILSYLKLRGQDAGKGLTVIIIISAISLFSTPLWGFISDKIGRKRLISWATLGIRIYIWAYFMIVDLGNFWFLLVISIIGMNIFHDAIYGPQAQLY